MQASEETGRMRQPTFYIPHGGGPCFFMEEHRGPPDMWARMAAFLAGLIPSLAERPRAILIVSGHWEEPAFTVHEGTRPPLLYDYYGFPEHTYRLRFDAPGAPDLAGRAADLLTADGFATGRESERGWDHGVFIPMKVALPDADLPIAQLSLKGGLNPAEHIAAGRALAPLRDDGVLILGSGMSFHNLRVRGPEVTPYADAFDNGLTAAVTDPDPDVRARRIADWASLPNARIAHPREEHLLPLMVAAGAGGDDPAAHVFRDHVLGWAISGYRFG